MIKYFSKTIIFFLLNYYISLSQTYRKSYDKIEQNSYGGCGACFRTNINFTLHSISSKFSQSYLNMYEATGDLKYLDKFIIQTKRIQDIRDDQIVETYNNNPLLTGIPETRANESENQKNHCDPPIACTITSVAQIQSKPVWSYIEDPCNCLWNKHSIIHVGSICYPMAQFVYLVENNSKLGLKPVQ